MEFRLLGAVSVVTEAGVLPLGPAKRRSLLAALLLCPNDPVLVDQVTPALVGTGTIVASSWRHSGPCVAPADPADRCRRRRVRLRVDHQGAAYVLRMPRARLDAHCFEDMVALARSRRGSAEALSLWRGPRWPTSVRAHRSRLPRTRWRSSGGPRWNGWP
ncbi:hypothetical protein ABZ442_20260 [Streptomyces triculaminicus]|uniref:hypothetical protein n=1 Tax=Streptomyces triculaminicus TaxID=2816232 RepID=UPI003404E99B